MPKIRKTYNCALTHPYKDNSQDTKMKKKMVLGKINLDGSAFSGHHKHKIIVKLEPTETVYVHDFEEEFEHMEVDDYDTSIEYLEIDDGKVVDHYHDTLSILKYFDYILKERKIHPKEREDKLRLWRKYKTSCKKELGRNPDDSITDDDDDADDDNDDSEQDDESPSDVSSGEEDTISDNDEPSCETLDDVKPNIHDDCVSNCVT